MPSRFYIEGDGRASGVKDLFAAIAPRYDLINDLQSFGLHRWWKRRLLGLAGVRPGERALDVCCGTGDIALGLARRGLRVTGLDFSDAMLAVARRRGERTGAIGEPANPEFIQGDALDLPFDGPSV
jgi:ubiquinone/menaquinone biosynthesis C-methylase UbiE